MKNFSVVSSLKRLLGRDEDEEGTPIYPVHSVHSKIRIHLHKAINGRVIEVNSYNPKPQSHESDWDSEFYLVPEGESLHNAVATVLTMKGLAL